MAYNELVKDLDGDSHQYAPNWLCLIVPFKYKSTLDRFKLSFFTFDRDDYSTEESKKNPTLEDDLILIKNDCQSWDISSTKESNVSSLSMTLAYSNKNYLDSINSKDWILFWAFDNRKDYNTIKDNIESGNFGDLIGPQSGFKFVGRVSSITASIAFSSTGVRSVKFNLVSHGFEELNSVIYFDPTIQKLREAWTTWPDLFSLNTIPRSATNIVSDTQSSVIRILLATLATDQTSAASKMPLARNPGNAIFTGEAQKDLRVFNHKRAKGGMTQSQNKMYIIPEIIKNIFKIDSRARGTLVNGTATFADLLNIYIGVHEYSEESMVPSFNTQTRNFFEFKNKLGDPHVTNSFYFNGQNIWSILESYLNRPINEMYTCLRLDHEGNIMPTLMVRRVPFTLGETAPSQLSDSNFDIMSPKFSLKTLTNQELKDSKKIKDNGMLPSPPALSFETTKFKSLPRWVLNNDMLTGINVGKNSVNRYNYIQVMPQREGADHQFTRSILKPINDVADITRSGLHMYNKPISAILPAQSTAAGGVNQESYVVNQWQAFLADFMMDGHLRLSGTVSCKGIQKPICHGDNLVIGRMLFHIEGVSHKGSESSDGKKIFETNIIVSNGMAMREDELEFYTNDVIFSKTIGIVWDFEK